MNDKIGALKANGTYNEHSNAVKAEHFHHGIFFDPRDLIQVKYEMVRSVEKDNLSVTEATLQYGFSRQTFYTCKEALEQEGIGGLVPKKTGPKTGYKLDDARKQFIDSYLQNHPKAKSDDIRLAIEEKYGIQLNTRTIDRYLAKK